MKTAVLSIVLLASGCVWIGIDPPHKEGDKPMSIAKDRTVTMKGNPLTLEGTPVKVGEKAPDFRVVDREFKPVRLSDFKGKVVLIAAVPSLDTGVCSRETVHFNQEIASLPPDVVMLTISMDLPFAQARFCESEKIDRIRVLSDSVWREFGERYGVRIKDMGLLARSIFVVGKDGRITYMELVPEETQFPNYEAALDAAREAAGVKATAAVK